jgi:hypothetical protein
MKKRSRFPTKDPNPDKKSFEGRELELGDIIHEGDLMRDPIDEKVWTKVVQAVWSTQLTDSTIILVRPEERVKQMCA